MVQVSELPKHVWARETGKFGAESQEGALGTGAKDLGYCVVTLDPGRRSCPLHFHHAEEEMFFVLKGKALLRQGKEEDGEYEEIEVSAGDFMGFPAGTGIAHQFVNHTEEPFQYMGVSTKVKADVAEYPDSNKVLCRGNGLMVQRDPKLKYFDGEV